MARSISSSTGYWSKSITSPPSISACSISAWLFATTLPTSSAYTLVGLSNGSASGAYIGLGVAVTGGNSQVIAFSSNGTQSNAAASPHLSASTYYHALATFAGSTQAIYLNGGNSNSTSTFTPGSAFTVASVGALEVGGSFISRPNQLVQIGEVGIWSATLTANEALTLATGERPFRVRPGSLYGYWPLFGLQSPEPDLSGNQLSLSLAGSSALANGPPVRRLARARTFFPLSSNGTAAALPASIATTTAAGLASGAGNTFAASVDSAVTGSPTSAGATGGASGTAGLGGVASDAPTSAAATGTATVTVYPGSAAIDAVPGSGGQSFTVSTTPGSAAADSTVAFASAVAMAYAWPAGVASDAANNGSATGGATGVPSSAAGVSADTPSAAATAGATAAAQPPGSVVTDGVTGTAAAPAAPTSALILVGAPATPASGNATAYADVAGAAADALVAVGRVDVIAIAASEMAVALSSPGATGNAPAAGTAGSVAAGATRAAATGNAVAYAQPAGVSISSPTYPFVFPSWVGPRFTIPYQGTNLTISDPGRTFTIRDPGLVVRMPLQ